MVIKITGFGTLRVETDKHEREFNVEFLNDIIKKLNYNPCSGGLSIPSIREFEPLNIKVTEQLSSFIFDYYIMHKNYERRNVIIACKNNIKYRLINFIVVGGESKNNLGGFYEVECSFNYVEKYL